MAGGMPVPDFLTYKQAAALARMSPWQLFIRVKRGEGPPIKRRGHFVYFPAKELLEWASRDVIP
jgi:hypothetical protein